MVYIEHETEPVIERRDARERIAEGRHHRRSTVVRWGMYGAIAAVVVYVGMVAYGWSTVNNFLNALTV